MLELRQTKAYAKYMKLIGWNIDVVDKTYCYSKTIPLIGSVIKIQRSENVVGKVKLEKLIRKRRAFMVGIEPIKYEAAKIYLTYGYKLTKSSSLPSKTLRLDLTKSEKQLLAKMHYKTRYNIKIARKRGVKIQKSEDINIFADFWQKCAKERGMFLPLKSEIKSIYEAFGSKATILVAYKDKDILAAILLVNTQNISYYMYAASTKIGKKLYAPTLLAWNSVKLAKKKGKKYFDFEGIYDVRSPIKTWSGFTRFKKSFGGKEVEFPLMLRKFYFPF